ncbi:MAG: hypothetical protein BACD_03017 [Bacteroides rodentium]
MIKLTFHLINSLNVLDNVELPLLYRNVSAKECRHLVEEVFKNCPFFRWASSGIVGRHTGTVLSVR